MYLIVNPLQKKEEQFAFLAPLLSSGIDHIYFVSPFEFERAEGRVTNVKIENRFRRFPSLRGFFKPLFPYINQHGPKADTMLIHDEVFSSSMIHAIAAKWRAKRKVIVYCAENTPYSAACSLLGFFFGRFVDGVLCPSEDAVRQVRRLGIRRAVECPIPVADTSRPVSEISQIRRVGFFGRLVPEKGILILCEAMKSYPELSLSVYGEGPLEKELMRYHVEYKGVYQPADLDRVFSGIDLLVVPSITSRSWKEQFGRVIVEAMARGILVIGSNSGAIPEVIGNDRLIFQENDIFALVNKIREITSLSSEELRQLSKGMRKRFEDRFSPAVVSRIFGDTIRSMG